MFGYGNIVLYGGTGCPDLAEELSSLLMSPLGARDVLHFSNENIFVRLHASVRGQDTFIIQTTSSPVNDNLMELLIFLDTLKRASAGRVTAVIPYLAYARSDKKDQPRVPITARLVADMIQIAGADRYVTMDLHAGQLQGFFSIPGDVLSAFPMLADHITAEKPGERRRGGGRPGLCEKGPQLRGGTRTAGGLHREAAVGGTERGSHGHR